MGRWPMGLGNHEVGSYIEAFGASTDAEGGKFSFRRSSSIYELTLHPRGNNNTNRNKFFSILGQLFLLDLILFDRIFNS